VQLIRILRAASALSWATATLLIVAGVEDGLAQAVKANFVAEGSFELPAKGRPGSLDRPAALALGPDGSLHIADSRGAVHVFDAGGAHRRVYGQPKLKRPVALAIAADGQAFVLDAAVKQVIIFGPEGAFLSTIGERGAKGGQLSDPVDLALGPSGHVYVLDPGRKGVQIFSWDGTFVRDIPLAESIREPMSLAVGNDGWIYIADKKTRADVYAFPPFTELAWAGNLPRGIAGRVSFRGAKFAEPVATAVNEKGTIVVLDKKAGRLFRKNAQGGGDIGPNDMLYGGIGTGRGSFREAVDIAFAGNNELVILDSRLRKIERIYLNTEEELPRRPDLGFPIRVTRVARGLPAPLLDIGFEPDGAPRFLLDMEKRGASLLATRAERFTTVYGDSVRVYYPDPKVMQRPFSQGIGDVTAAAITDTMVVIADSRKNRFAIFGLQGGAPLGTYGDNYQDDRRLKNPRGVAVLPDGRIVIADTGNNRVKVFSSDLASLVASYPVNKPVGVAVAPDGGIFVWNERGTVVGRLNPNEARLEPLPAALLPGPIAALTFDQAGNLFLLDLNTQRVTIIEEGLDRVLIRLGAEGVFERPTRINVDGEGNIYISDEGSGRTTVYRWDVHFPPLAGLDLEYEGDVAVLSWKPGPARYTRGYEIQGAEDPAGPWQVVATAEAPPYRIVADELPERPPRYIRVAPVFTTGVRGLPTEALPLSYFTATAAFKRGDFEAALREAGEGLRLVDEGVLDASDEVKGRLLRLAFASAYELGDYKGAVGWAQRAALIPMPRDELIEFLFMLADIYVRLGDPREASQQILTLVGQGPRPEYYQRRDVIQQSFLIYRRLRDAGYPEDALEFIRLYAQSMPESVPEEFRYMYDDSITVFSTRQRLAQGFEYWKSADYGQVVNFFEGMLTEGGLSAEQRVISWQILAAAYYAFGRRAQAEDTFKQIFGVRPNFNVSREIPRLQKLYDLQIYNPETRRFFGNIGPRS
jgi:sugar lactone lactonase YvrE/tetratricopeptide (TPR) repeat protein